MSDMISIQAWTFDVGLNAKSIDDYVEAIASRVEQSWSANADVVLFPEYAWAALLAHTQGSVRELAEQTWQNIFPSLAQRLNRPGKLAVLGSSPHWDAENHRLTNRAAIIIDGQLAGQDKLFLTPWESSFQRGDALRLFRFAGLTVAVIICLDIEIPEISAALRGQGVDVILCPSATETVLGCERVTRCASARAVELGCAVVVSPLVGKCATDLVDENLGKLAVYLPSQAVFADAPRSKESDVITAGFASLSFQLDRRLLGRMRSTVAETNPSLLVKSTIVEPIRLVHL